MLDRSQIRGRKLKDVKPSSKKRSASPPFKIPKKHLRYTKGEAPTARSTKDVEGVVDVVGPKVAFDFGVNMTVGHTMPPSSPTHVSLTASPRLDELDRLMGQALADLATTFEFDLTPMGQTQWVHLL